MKTDKKVTLLRQLVGEGKNDIDIAHALNISLAQVEKLRRKHGLLNEGEYAVAVDLQVAETKKVEAAIAQKLSAIELFKTTKRYESLAKRLPPEELGLFLEVWATYAAQFEHPTATEEDSIELMIITKMKMDFNDREYMSLQKQTNSLEKQLDGFGEEPDYQDDEVRAVFQQLETVRKLRNEVLKQSHELADKFSAYQKALNATREQREKTKGISGDTFLSLVKQFTDKDKRAQIGRQAALVRLSTENKIEKFNRPHTYMNGEVNPIIMDGADQDES